MKRRINQRATGSVPRVGVFDFFSGCGGSSKGFQNAGLEPLFALDRDTDAVYTFKTNFPRVRALHAKIESFDPACLDDLLSPTDLSLFCGCAPCQPFTRQNTTRVDNKRDSRRSLLASFGEAVAAHEPDYVFVENVPGLQRVAGNSTLSRFRRRLESIGYNVCVGVLESQAYGVPQRRRRLVLLASKRSRIELPEPTHGPLGKTPFSTVRDWISHFPPIEAGEAHPAVPSHIAANLSPLNLRRIMATPAEGSRADWPEELRLACHTTGEYSGHSDVYGRMRWDAPATGLTTRCISLSNGRYGHPEQNRAISAREAAALQTFPDNFRFSGSLASQARQIGNAVPVLLAEVFGRHILRHAQVHAG